MVATSLRIIMAARVKGQRHLACSHIDSLCCINAHTVILDWDEWQQGKPHLLAVNTEQSPPQHCHLQRLRHDLPLPQAQVDLPSDVIDSEGRVLHTNTRLDFHEILRK